MSTMAGNGLLMKALMSLRQNLSDNTIDSKEYKETLKLSQFGNEFGNGILHWNKPNPFTQNYAQFIDNVNNPKILAKQMRVSTPNESSMAFKMATKMLQLQSKLSLFRKII